MENVETVIIGAGQAGLATAQRLRKRGRDCVVLDHNQRIGDNWRRQWDSLRLYSPAKFDGLPGMRFPADPWSFPTKDDMAAYLEAYARPVGSADAARHPRRRARPGHRTTASLSPLTPGRSSATTWWSRPAPSGGRPLIPDYATELDPSILQLHSSEYRRPGQLRDGPVLVIGASHSGTDIAYELAATDGPPSSDVTAARSRSPWIRG